MSKVRYTRNINSVDQLPAEARMALGAVSERFKFRANDYYLGLIDWDDPDDPIRKIVIPEYGELEEFGKLDASNEESNYVVPGCQHKYRHTALLICNEVCGAYCRFCFRKRLFMDDNDEVVNDVTPGIEYIRAHREITNVLLTGGDPLLMSTRKLEAILRPLREIPHVQIIRLGSKMPAFNPYRIIDDPELTAVFARYSTRQKRIYVMAHYNVPRELTDVSCHALDLLTLRRIPDLAPHVEADIEEHSAEGGSDQHHVHGCKEVGPFASLCWVDLVDLRLREFVGDARMTLAAGLLQVVGVDR